jgi:hypothetical protein
LAGSDGALGALEFFGEFFADDRELRRCFDTDADAAMANLDHGDRDLIADQNPFADFSTEN